MKDQLRITFFLLLWMLNNLPYLFVTWFPHLHTWNTNTYLPHRVIVRINKLVNAISVISMTITLEG